VPYAGARFHSADLGRFLSPDPVGGNYANPQSLNPYSYGMDVEQEGR
jgi:RHS repeat-associated protein